MNNEPEVNPHGVGTGKVFLGKGKLEVTRETHKDRNTNFRKIVKGLFLGMIEHSNYKTLNLQGKTYLIELRLAIVPEKVPEKIVVPDRKLIKVVK